MPVLKEVQMRKMWLHPKLYTLLPVAYLLSGVLILDVYGDEPLGILSGSMLCAAAVLIWVLRIYGAKKTASHKQ